jgi:hypothetical protein
MCTLPSAIEVSDGELTCHLYHRTAWSLLSDAPVDGGGNNQTAEGTIIRSMSSACSMERDLSPSLTPAAF